jgi:hypothetical protein
MNLYDFLTILFLGCGLIVGLWQGLIRSIVIAVVAYACLLLAGLYFQRVGDSIHLVANYNLLESHIIAFIVVFLLTSLVLVSMGSYTFRFVGQELFGSVGRIGAAILSIVVFMAVWGVFASLLLQLRNVSVEPSMQTFFMSSTNITAITEAKTLPIVAQIFTNPVLQLMDPFVFSDVYDIFPSAKTTTP